MAPTEIPIENIYYLLSYAWDVLPEAGLADVSVTPEMKIQELLARVLKNGVSHLLKRGLDRTYMPEVGELAGVRGRIEIDESLKRSSFPRGRAVCSFDELSSDALHNRIVKTTLRQLAAAVDGPDSNRDLAEELRALYRRMAGVNEIRVTTQLFRRVVLHRNTRAYRLLLDVCEIAHNNLLVDETSGRVRFRDFTRDDRQMAVLFQKFLFRFFERERDDYEVSAPTLRWNAAGDVHDLAYLPQMRTDVVLNNSRETIVIDAKYYGKALSEYWGKQSIHPNHLYQMFAYMTHLATEGRERGRVRGILIYPRTTEAVRVTLSLGGHPFLAATVDLSRQWQDIRDCLMKLIC